MLRLLLAALPPDSWGSSTPVYDFQASKADMWLYKHQDCISHFAAGNYGENDALDTTITSPATAKNVMTVGATKSLMPNYISQTIAPVFMMTVEISRKGKPAQKIFVRLVKAGVPVRTRAALCVHAACCWRSHACRQHCTQTSVLLLPPLCLADFGGEGSNLGKTLPILRADPPNACGGLVGADTGKYNGAIVLARRGTCFFSEKMTSGAAAGAAAVIVINNL